LIITPEIARSKAKKPIPFYFSDKHRNKGLFQQIKKLYTFKCKNHNPVPQDPDVKVWVFSYIMNGDVNGIDVQRKFFEMMQAVLDGNTLNTYQNYK
jgi:hypothetical protein